MGAAVERGVSEEDSLAGGVEAATAVDVDEPALPASSLSDEACPAASCGAEAPLTLPEFPALPVPPVDPNPRVRGCTEDSPADDRSTKPSVARSSGGRNLEPSQRKM
jgi:hypothetical protein